MKRYLIFGNGESPHILKWTRELVKHFEVYLVSSQDVAKEIRELVPADHIFTFNLKVSESGGNIKFIKTIAPLKRIINKVQPDFVNAHYITSHGFVTAMAKKFSRHNFKLIQSAWGTDILVTPRKNLIYKMVTRFSLKQADLATADSPRVEEIIQSLSGTQTMVFPFGMDSLPDIQWSEKDPDFFFSNRTLNTNSNIDRVLHFFAKVYDQNKNALLVIANDGPNKEILVKLTHELGIENVVEFAGFINADQQDEYYRKAQFYFSVLSSDALSVSLLEAMAYGCIPIVSDLPDNKDWVKDHVSGIIMSSGARPDILSGLQEKAEEIFGQNRKSVEEKAIFPKSIEDYYQKLQNI